ncbi:MULTISPECIES: efflux RND transporter permease subunit [unclassified Pseudoalteromonas]|uniref:efflux RND transporter permease subunit n=1 Tax=unclassified Pseudoalteromonas TaxID=194690 RepID=UPI0020973487|nr:efflux RND transporter permease subunit [Pseudoalteromonas sp. XMcav2-N]MCO7191086.1 efflux RND transporter permease subunit [Pseudoalteromonas sp. XMcav2-N]
MSTKASLTERILKQSLSGNLPALLFFFAIVLGALALQFMPREEEPQIVVPMLDIHVTAPNIAAPEVVRLVTTPLEKLLMQIPGVEHVYSTTNSGNTVVTLRFHVGESREQAILNTYTKLYANEHQMAAVVSDWQIRPVEVDDVPIVMLGLYSEKPEQYDDYDLTRFAQEISTQLQQLPDTSEVKVVAGRQRTLNVWLDATALAAHQSTPLDVLHAIQSSNQLQQVGKRVAGNKKIVLEAGDVLRTSDALRELVITVVNGRAVKLKDVARIEDGPGEPEHYQWLALNDEHQSLPLVTISVAKQKGSNAVAVAEQVHRLMRRLQAQLLPPEVAVKVLRDYGQTADEKVNDLMASLVFAVLTVVIFVGVFLGWRPAIVVGLAIPVCYGITLALDWAFGYTINRVTLFALILSLGLLVDDPITGIDNISRLLLPGKSRKQQIMTAMTEIRTALLMSTLTIMMAFLPLAYITGMMGPYMAPMAFNVPLSVMISTIVAFFITPWLASRLLTTKSSAVPSQDNHWYAALLTPLLRSPRRAKGMLWAVLALFVLSASLPVFRAVPLKLLPYDNKNEVQVLIDLPEGRGLEATARLTRAVQQRVWQINEVNAIAAYVGQPSSMDFNGMVRGYYRRHSDNLAELRVLLLDKSERVHQSHAVVLRLRDALAEFNRDGTVVKVVEVPPGPPVMSTLTAEVYAEPFVSEDTHREAALQLMTRLRQEAHVVEVDTSLSAPATLQRFVTDKQKAALSGVSSVEINQTLALSSKGMQAGLLYQPGEAQPVPINLQLAYADRQRWSALLATQIRGSGDVTQEQQGFGLSRAARPMVALSELGEVHTLAVEPAIYRKDLAPVIYVFAELNGRTPAEVIADVVADEQQAGMSVKSDTQAIPWQQRTFLSNGGVLPWQLPEGTSYRFSGEGEWRITVRVFRDMGIAFAFALAAIFVILRWQTASNAVALIIMSAIPLTMIGIMPGFWALNQFGERTIAGAPDPVLFTATAMIGMIALAGIVVRNSLILVEFITQARQAGMPIMAALIRAGSVRMRPVLLTAGTTLLGNLVIILDPVFSGLALAIMFGIVASTLFSLLVVPVVYYLVFRTSDDTAAPTSISDSLETTHV